MPKNILVIDDEPLITRSLEKLLKVSGYNAVVAATAEQALQKVKEIDFDLIISDVRMPGTDGIEAIEMIRGYLKENGKQPIREIFITGYADEDYYKAALRLKVVDYIYKPFDTQELLDAIRKHIG